MKNFTRFLLAVLVALTGSHSVFAYNFEVNGIYYNITSSLNLTCEVTYCTYPDGDDWEAKSYNFVVSTPVNVNYSEEPEAPDLEDPFEPNHYVSTYSGEVIVPSSVKYNGKIYSVTSIGNYAFGICNKLTSVVIPNSVKTIGYSAFAYCSELKSIEIPSSVTEIGSYAFAYSNRLTSVEILNSITKIVNNTFEGCSSLTSVVIPNTVSEIGYSAFSGCSSLSSVVIPNSVTQVADNAFDGCTSLPVINNVRYADTYLIEAVDRNQSSYFIKEGTRFIGVSAFDGCTNLESTKIPDSVISIASNAFSGCVGLTSIKISNSVAKICSSTFSGCSGLTSVVIPNSVTDIDYKAFSGCSSLMSVVISSSATWIDALAFENCKSLKEITSLNTTPPHIDYSTFRGVSKTECVLKVPAEALEAYKSADNWSDFLNIEVNEIFSLVDAEEYSQKENIEVRKVAYCRTFNNTELQPLYVPFSMSYNDWCNDFDVYRINGFYEYDRNDDGLVDEHLLEVIRVTEKNGSLKPNYPYLIKAKTTGEKTITLKNATLYAAETNSIDCSTVDTKYTFTGTYNKMNGLKSAGYYCLSDGKLCPAANDDVTLGAFRWYLKVESRGAQFVSAPAKIMVRIKGEDATGIEEIGAERSVNAGKVFSLDGRLMDSESLPGGIYIKNGKKFIIK